MKHPTAGSVFDDFTRLSLDERTKFYQLLGEGGIQKENFTHSEVFGHLASAEFTAAEAAEYLDVSISTFRRYVRDKKLKAAAQIGRSDVFATTDLKAFKRSLREVKGS